MASKFSSMLKPEARSLVLDNTKINYFESAIFACFRVDIRDIINIKAQLGKAFHIQPSEVDKMPFWELEYYIKELEKMVAEANEENQNEVNKAGLGKLGQMADPKNMSKMMSTAAPKLPDIKMPSINMKMPSF